MKDSVLQLAHFSLSQHVSSIQALQHDNERLKADLSKQQQINAEAETQLSQLNRTLTRLQDLESKLAATEQALEQARKQDN